MWRSLLLHEIPGGDLRNYGAVPGSVSAGSLLLNPEAIGPGQEFEYTFDSPLTEVIGISVRVRLRKPIAGYSTYRIARAGTDVEFSVQRLNTPPVDWPLAAHYRALLRVGPGPVVPVGVVLLPHRYYVDIRVDWHTSGQARVMQDRELVGYHNAVSTGSSVTIPSVAFGRSDVTPGPGSSYGVGRFFVRALRRIDSLDAFSRLLPEIPTTDDDMLARCRQLALSELLQMANGLRPFMAMFHQQFSTPWDPVSGNPNGPLSEESVDAHRLALAAGAALVQMLRRGDFKQPEHFLEPFEALLRTLHDALPNAYESLAQSLLNSPRQLDEECVALLTQGRLDHGETMGPLFELIDAASAIVERISGGQ